MRRRRSETFELAATKLGGIRKDWDFYYMPHPDKPMICPKCKKNHLEAQVKSMAGKMPPKVRMIGPSLGAICPDCKADIFDVNVFVVLEENGKRYWSPDFCLMPIPLREQRMERCTHMLQLTPSLQMQCPLDASDEGRCTEHYKKLVKAVSG